MPEVLKRINIDDIILHFANKMLLENETPEQCSTLNILPIPKSGDLSIAANYGGIALTSLVAKVINRMILNHIRPIIDPELRGNQEWLSPWKIYDHPSASFKEDNQGSEKKESTCSHDFYRLLQSI